MRELPMLLNGHGVRATLARTKTMTRRPMRSQPSDFEAQEWYLIQRPRCFVYLPSRKHSRGMTDAMWNNGIRSTHGIPGDLLYVRETWLKQPDPDPELGGFEIRYRATDHVDAEMYGGWRPSIHMPKWAARLWVRNTGIRVGRVRDISEDDVLAEGICRIEEVNEDLSDYKVYFESDAGRSTCPFEAYAWLWDSIYAKRGLGWDSNCWVWVTEYEVIE